MRQYINLLERIVREGIKKTDGTKSIIGAHMRMDLADGFPLLTTRRVDVRPVVKEVLRTFRGETSQGRLWRAWPQGESGVDQIAKLIQDINYGVQKGVPSRRLLLTSWNPPEVVHSDNVPREQLAQFYLSHGVLSCQVFQGSSDVMVDFPVDVVRYALLTHMMSKACLLNPGELIWVFGYAYIQTAHIELAKLQMARTPKDLPGLDLNACGGDTDFRSEDFVFSFYDPHPAIELS